MKATITFNLDDTDEASSYKIFMHANDMHRLIIDFKNLLRTSCKHGLPEDIKTLEEAADYFQIHFYDLLEQYEVPEI